MVYGWGRLSLIAAAALLVAPSRTLANDSGGKGERIKKVPITADARSQAADIFTERCAACHGADGRGNGPAAANLKPRPIDFHSRSWQHSVSDDVIAQAIIQGGKAVGRSGEMAANPDLEDQPAVVAALVERIRKYGK